MFRVGIVVESIIRNTMKIHFYCEINRILKSGIDELL